MSIYFANEMLTFVWSAMSTEVQFNLRIPAALKEKIADAAKSNSRSINAEAQLRLEDSLHKPEDNLVDFESGYKTALTHASLALGRVLSEKGIEWSEIQKTALFMLDEVEKIRRSRQKK
ncbi:hypothetical protein Asch03_02091 [Acinetobacter schindleri]